MSFSSWLSASWSVKLIHPLTSWGGGAGSMQRSWLHRVRRELCARKWSAPCKKPQEVAPALRLIVGARGEGQREHLLSLLLDPTRLQRDSLTEGLKINIPKPLLGKHGLAPRLFHCVSILLSRARTGWVDYFSTRNSPDSLKGKEWIPTEGLRAGSNGALLDSSLVSLFQQGWDLGFFPSKIV